MISKECYEIAKKHHMQLKFNGVEWKAVALKDIDFLYGPPGPTRIMGGLLPQGKSIDINKAITKAKNENVRMVAIINAK